MNDLLDFLGPVRKDLVLALKERGEATAPELADATFLSIAAARSHLLVLERSGLVTYQRRREGVGRPAHRYRLSEQGEALFPQGYAALSRALMAIAHKHPACKDMLLSEMEESQVSLLGAHVTASEPRLRIEQLADAMRRQGFAIELEQREHRTWEMRMGHCPLLQVAREFPAICEVEERVLSGGVGPDATVEYLSRQSEGQPKCVAVMRWPSAETA